MRILFFILLMVVCNGIFGQYAQNYSNYVENGLLINPAFAGKEEVMSISLLYRNQWIGFDGAPVYQTASLHSPMKNPRIGLGVSVINEKRGILKHTNAYFIYAYRIELGHGKLSLGLRAGINSGKQEYLELEDDPAFNRNSENYILPNFGVGAYYYSDLFFIGISVPEMLSTKINLANGGHQIKHDFQTYNFHFTGGVLFGSKESLQYQPSFLIKYSLSAEFQAEGGVNLIYKDRFSGGLAYRMHDSFIVLAGFRLNQQLRVGLAYDYSLGKLSKYNNGTLEIMVKYRFGYMVNTTTLRNF